MKRKAFASFILTLSLIILNINICYCSAFEIITGINAAYNAVNNASSVQEKKDAIRNWIYKNSEAAGFMFDLTTFNPTADFLINLLPDDIVESLGSNPSEEAVIDAVQDFILDNQTVSNNSIVNDHSVNVFIENFSNNFEEMYWTEVHPFNLDDSRNYNWWTSNESFYFNKLKSLVTQYQNDYYIYFYGGTLYNNSKALVICVKKEDVVLVRATGLNTYFTHANTLHTNGDLISTYSSAPESTKVFYWESNTGWLEGDISLVKTSVFGNNFKCLAPLPNYYLTTSGTSWQGNSVIDTGKLFSVGEKTYYFYNSYSIYASVPFGCNPYYYNNSVWQDFSSSSGDYTLTNNNINTVTYGDTVSYINDYHDTNNNYPDNSTVNNWIETTNNNNNSGGGSGDDPGGGSGSDDSGSIFDWLKTLGKAIGDLIKGVGNFLSEIVAGLVDAITNLLDSITTLITGVLESLTNIFSGLIEFIFAGLPDDIRNVLSLALTVAILISVLKLIRGN